MLPRESSARIDNAPAAHRCCIVAKPAGRHGTAPAGWLNAEAMSRSISGPQRSAFLRRSAFVWLERRTEKPGPSQGARTAALTHNFTSPRDRRD
jgi:hypothetical protein